MSLKITRYFCYSVTVSLKTTRYFCYSVTVSLKKPPVTISITLSGVLWHQVYTTLPPQLLTQLAKLESNYLSDM